VTHLPFNYQLKPRGYAWWYVDLVSDDACYACTVIAFVGNVFSPAYYRASMIPDALPSPYAFPAINAVIYNLKSGKRLWLFEQGAASDLTATEHSYQLGSHLIRRTPSSIDINIDGHCMPIARRLQATLSIDLNIVFDQHVALDRCADHHWYPVAPLARASLTVKKPTAINFSGKAYHDCNYGCRPLSESFTDWWWMQSRNQESTESTVHYHCSAHQATDPFSVRFDTAGEITMSKEPSGRDADQPTSSQIATTRRASQGNRTRKAVRKPTAELLAQDAKQSVVKRLWRSKTITLPPELVIDARITPLETSPFYQRSLVKTKDGETQSMHEYLDFHALTKPWVQRLIPFRLSQTTGSIRLLK